MWSLESKGSTNMDLMMESPHLRVLGPPEAWLCYVLYLLSLAGLMLFLEGDEVECVFLN